MRWLYVWCRVCVWGTCFSSWVFFPHFLLVIATTSSWLACSFFFFVFEDAALLWFVICVEKMRICSCFSSEKHVFSPWNWRASRSCGSLWDLFSFLSPHLLVCSHSLVVVLLTVSSFTYVPPSWTTNWRSKWKSKIAKLQTWQRDTGTQRTSVRVFHFLMYLCRTQMLVEYHNNNNNKRETQLSGLLSFNVTVLLPLQYQHVLTLFVLRPCSCLCACRFKEKLRLRFDFDGRKLKTKKELVGGADVQWKFKESFDYTVTLEHTSQMVLEFVKRELQNRWEHSTQGDRKLWKQTFDELTTHVHFVIDVGACPTPDTRTWPHFFRTRSVPMASSSFRVLLSVLMLCVLNWQ